jgi:hypothetical protein
VEHWLAACQVKLQFVGVLRGFFEGVGMLRGFHRRWKVLRVISVVDLALSDLVAMCCSDLVRRKSCEEILGH